MKTKKITATITKAVAGIFTAYHDGKKFTLFAPKKFRYNEQDIVVGDKVEFEITAPSRGIISSVLQRKNKLIRPEIANLDIAFIVIAQLPQPDFMLVDKIIINCIVENIKPIIIINKCDLPESELFVESVVKQYSNVCQVIAISAISGEGVSQLTDIIDGHTVCFAGQSAVGKTSLLNVIIPNLQNKVGELSQKTQRGMHTTRHSQIYPLKGGFVADTTGFSLLDIDDIDSRQLMLYYADFAKYQNTCKYNMCTHTVEPQCSVKTAVDNGEISSERYQRYVRFYNELVEKERNKYN